jgi:hypothetical protein
MRAQAAKAKVEAAAIEARARQNNQFWQGEIAAIPRDYGIDPAFANSAPGKIAGAGADMARIVAEGAVPFVGVPAVISQSALQAQASGYNGGEEQAKLSGETDPEKIAAAGQAAGDQAYRESLELAPLYLATGVGAGAATKALLPKASALWRAMAGGGAAGAGNLAVSAAARKL